MSFRPFTYGQVSVTSAPTPIAPADPARTTLVITNSGTTDVWLGDANVTTSTGLLLAGVKGQTQILPAETGAIYGIVSSTSESVSYMSVQ